MIDDIEIRTLTDADLPALYAFYRQAYGERAKYKFPDRWNWLVAGSVLCGRNDRPAYIAISANKIIGLSATIRARCKIFDEKACVSWWIDSHVLREFRGIGIGKKLQLIHRDDNDIVAGIAMTKQNTAINKKIGAFEGPEAAFFCKMLSYEGQVRAISTRYGEKHLKLLLVANYLSFLCIKSLVKLRETANNRSTHYTVSQPEPAVFTSSDVDLWNSVREKFDFAVERDFDYLQWRYVEQPHTKHYCIRAFNSSGVLSGLMIYRLADENIDIGCIVDELIVASDEEENIADSLLGKCESCVREQGVSQIHIATSDYRIINILLGRGFFIVEKKPLIINSNNEKVRNLNSESEVMLTKGDQDWDQFPIYRNYDAISIIYRLMVRLIGSFRNLRRIFE